MYAVLNVLPVLVNSGMLPESLKQKVLAIVAQQDHIYQYAVQIEALMPFVILSLFITRRSARIITTAFIYSFVFLRVRYMTNYATHGLLSSVNNSIRSGLARIPIVLKIYDFIANFLSRGMPDSVITQSMLADAIQHPHNN